MTNYLNGVSIDLKGVTHSRNPLFTMRCYARAVCVRVRRYWTRL